MKKTQRKDAIRNIKKRIVSFLSVCLVVALGLGALFTTRYTAAGLDKEYSAYYNARNFKDFELIASLGVSESSLEKIRSVEGVTAAEGVMLADGVISFGDKNRNAVVSSVTKEVSVPELTDGSLPSGREECMIGEDFAELEGLKTGDRIGITLSGMDALGDEQPLYKKEFTITGLMHNPEQFKRMSVNTVALPIEAFNEEATNGLYTEAYVRIEEPEKVSMFSNAYFEETADTKKALEDLTVELGEDRTREMQDEAYANIDEEWEEALTEMEDAQAEIDDGEAELNSSLADGRKELHDAENTLAKTVAKYKKQISEGEKKIKEAEDKIAEIDKKLPGVKKQNKELREKYNGEIENSLKEIAEFEKKIEELKKIGDMTSSEYGELIKEIAQLVLDKQETIRSIRDFFARDDVKEIAQKIKDISDGKLDLTGIVKTIGEADVERLITLAETIEDFDPSLIDQAQEFIDGLNEYVASIKDAIAQLDETDAYIKEYEENRSSIIARIDKKKKKLEDAKTKLKSEQEKYEKKIKAGWATYYAEKAKYETKLEEAKLTLEENREEAEKKLEEARDEVANMDPCNWILLDRNANAGYVTARSNITATTTAGNVFGLLFMIVTAIVCFSTLVIIIDEQKTLVGTSKAFGFHKREILGKYLTFGAAAALAGSALSVVIGMVLSVVVQNKLASAGLVQVGAAPSVFTPGITIGATLLITAVAIIASVVACGDILRSPASMLMNGTVLRKNKKKKKESRGGGSLYSKLIMRNMADDKARVTVTIAIIAFSCMLIGMGASMKLAFDGMIQRQTEDINKYDFIMNMGDKVSEKEEAALAKVLEENGVQYLPATVSSSLYRWDSRVDGLQMVCADASRLGEFFAVVDPKTGKAIEIPDEGILIQKRLNESFGMNVGDKLPLLDSTFKEHDAEVKGYFANYVGRMIVVSPAAYRSIFGKANETNSYYVRLDGADGAGLKNKLLAVTDEISFAEKSDFKATLDSASQLYNIMVVVITGMAILISFMILTNLSNIFLNRRKTELSVMRVNGFSVKQAKGYLRRETIITTAAGLALGVILGALLTPPVMTILQQTDMELVKSFHTAAWVMAVVIETIFAVIINSLVFSKVKKLNLRDIAG